MSLRAGSFRRAAFLFSAVALFKPLFHATSAQAQTRPAGYEEGIVAVVARDLPPVTLVVLADSAGTLLMPLGRIAEMVGMPVQQLDSTHLLVPRIDGGVTTIDLAALTISSGDVVTPVTPAEMVVSNGDVYLTTARLASVLQANATFDAPTLTLVLQRDPLFPAQQMLAIEQRRALLVARDRAATPEPLVVAPFRPATGAGVLDWEVTSNNIDPTRLLQLRGRAGFAVWGGGLTVGGATILGRDEHSDFDNDFTVRYHRVFTDARYVTQLDAGDIITAGLFARFLRGVQLTNAPQERSYDLGTIMLRPDLPAGWQYEVLQNGQLLGYSDAVTRDAVSVPLRSGSSPVSIRMYGPAGQQQETTLLYQTPTTLLRRGRFEYAAAAGRCNGDLCTRYGTIDARYGRWTRATIGMGAEYIADSTGSVLRPYAVTSFTTGTLLTGEVQVMPGAVYRSTFAIYPGESTTGTLSAGISSPGYGRVSVIPNTRSRWDLDAQWDQRLTHAIGPFRSVRGGIGGSGLTSGSIATTRFSVASSMSSGYAEVRLERSDVSPDLFSARTSVLLRNDLIPSAVRRFLPENLRPLVDGGIGVNSVGIALLHGGIAVQHDRYGSLSTGIEWLRGNGGARVSLSWSRTFHSAQAIARAVSDPQGFATSTMTVRGAISVSPDGNVQASPYPREGYGGISGTVFIDKDGDGVNSAGDEVVPDANMIIGNTRVLTDANGHYQAWGLLPYAALRVRIDSTGGGDPGWITAREYIAARPVPNTSIKVDVALLMTSEVSGSIHSSEGVATAAGVTVELVPEDGSDPIATVTFSDGQFYISKVRPGRYSVRVAKSSLDALGAVAEPETSPMVVPRGGGGLVELKPIVLKPRG
jgi:hypothetical protein